MLRYVPCTFLYISQVIDHFLHCILQYLTRGHDALGVETLCRVVQSIDPKSKEYHHPSDGSVLRATISDVWLFREAPNGKLEYIVKSCHDMNGNVPEFMANQSSLSFWRIVKKLSSLSDTRRILSMNHSQPQFRRPVERYCVFLAH